MDGSGGDGSVGGCHGLWLWKLVSSFLDVADKLYETKNHYVRDVLMLYNLLCAVILVIQIEMCQCGQCVAPD